MSMLSSPSASEDDFSLASSPGGSMVLEAAGFIKKLRIEIAVVVMVLTLAVSKVRQVNE